MMVSKDLSSKRVTLLSLLLPPYPLDPHSDRKRPCKLGGWWSKIGHSGSKTKNADGD